MKSKIIRNSNIELMRIVAILLIISQHLIERGTGNVSYAILQLPISWRFLISSILGNWGQLGVILFVMITSWFMVDRKGIKFKRFFEITFQTWITSMLILFLGLIFIPNLISFKLIIQEVLTPFVQQYWFVSTFLLFYLMLPILQMVTYSIKPKSAKFLWILFTPFVPIYNYYQQNVGGNLMDFIYIFLFVAYLKSNKNNWFERKRNYFFIGIFLIIILEMIAKMIVPANYFLDIYIKIRGRTFITMVTAAMIFYCFLNLKIDSNKVINYFGKASFGVYLLHDNILFRPLNNNLSVLWGGLLKVDNWYFNSPYFIIFHIAIVILLFIILSPISYGINKISLYIIKKNFYKLYVKLDKLYDSIFTLKEVSGK